MLGLKAYLLVKLQALRLQPGPALQPHHASTRCRMPSSQCATASKSHSQRLTTAYSRATRSVGFSRTTQASPSYSEACSQWKSATRYESLQTVQVAVVARFLYQACKRWRWLLTLSTTTSLRCGGVTRGRSLPWPLMSFATWCTWVLAPLLHSQPPSQLPNQPVWSKPRGSSLLATGAIGAALGHG